MASKINIELKYFCPDFPAIRNVLKWLGAEKAAVKNQKDYFFNLPAASSKNQGRLKLRIENGEKTLIYYERPPFAKYKQAASKVLLYPVSDRQLLGFLQKTLGLAATVKKRREVWRKGNTVFHLDAVENVGNIFEVELQKNGGISKADRHTFGTYQKALIPHLGKMIKGSNIDLVLRK